MIVERQDNGSLLISDMIEGYWLKKFITFILKKKPLNFLKTLKKNAD
jgi:hypothetical protein